MKRINYKFGTALFASALMLQAGAQAAEVDDRYYLTPGASYIIADDDRKADDDVGFQLGIGRALSEHWNLELTALGDTLDRSSGNSKFTQRGLGLDGLFLFSREAGFSPYLVIGAGALRTKLSGDAETHAMVNAGAGFMTRLTQHGLALRADARYRLDNDSNSLATEDRFDDWVFNLGFSIPLGVKDQPQPAQAEPQPAQVAMAPADSDGDGVMDDSDECPNSRRGSKVDAVGCEIRSDSDNDGVLDDNDRCPDTAPGVKVDSRGCEVIVDSDGDGVIDALDQCASTPAGMKVDARGCEVVFDSDNDGVTDKQDQCPDTQPGAKVDNKGCTLKAIIKLEGVNFATNSAELSGDSINTLDDAAATLLKNPDLVVEVAGHTDNRGNRAYNIDLSQRRATTVMNYLISRGVSADKLSAKGYGPDMPVGSNTSAEGMAANRRVELRLLNH